MYSHTRIQLHKNIQAFVVSVVDTALAAVNTLGNLVGLLDMVNGIVENDINMPDIQDAAIVCVCVVWSVCSDEWCL